MSAAPGRRLIVEADGGSRGNPGPAGYGAVVRDASTQAVLREESSFLGVATNNFAEYQGLLAGLRAARSIDPSAFLDVRMDSRLVVEQMSGRWQVKHPDLRPLVREAASLAAGFAGVSYTWIPRERNRAADALANKAMDAGTGRGPAGRPGAASRSPVSAAGSASGPASRPASGPASASASGLASGPASGPNRIVGWGPALEATTLAVVRHGVTAFTLEKRFAGISDPPLVEQGRLQAKMAAERLAARGDIGLVVSSPLSRCRDTAAIIAGVLGVSVEHDDDLRETDFGLWEGLTFETVQERWPRELSMWLADTSISPPDGESYESVRHRILLAQQRWVNRNRGHVICVVTHSRPVALFVANALDAATSSIYRLHVDPASVSEISYYDDGPAVLRTFNDTSHLR